MSIEDGYRVLNLRIDVASITKWLPLVLCTDIAGILRRAGSGIRLSVMVSSHQYQELKDPLLDPAVPWPGACCGVVLPIPPVAKP